VATAFRAFCRALCTHRRVFAVRADASRAAIVAIPSIATAVRAKRVILVLLLSP
jgi:hypothetical protein